MSLLWVSRGSGDWTFRSEAEKLWRRKLADPKLADPKLADPKLADPGAQT